ncbi:Uncharacterised protein [Mycobacteroides abscessus subsp. bolletii]|uniref:hypothetical protein n=1 Tax=Mycobacteroides abscessus TaxID=36809 RepID=UPI0009279D0D|nr:hypothetical protein [Mycobacteroides abscessus]SHQ62449.1 Uncharacterised protein [Mycobacteroides abscessus subsp. bolletii]SHS46138.1 Uncharacterised protein [Mycobacteroides abscessus subsp. bolletii]SHT08679.1 Uncharacterised protein [Mycobacteroides abscessus subsp. bolletii]SHT13037.1 Uncharacterised protein [Mycobacteroides abscessus subsp. bolletii]SHY51575.1 Uncharacterised protein [Mycobacteroides abscessus subsp. bolletii]
MSDPAIEAVQRVVDKWGEGRISQWSRAQMRDAAREMSCDTADVEKVRQWQADRG